MAIQMYHISNMMKIESGAKAASVVLLKSATDAHHGLADYTGQVHHMGWIASFTLPQLMAPG
jgi:hypothetical protein